MFENVLANLKLTNPVVHCITNYVTVNDCANIILAVGASPIMADDLEEVADITAISKALVINIGTLNQRTIRSMIASGKKANQIGVPVILDPVGAGASALRNEAVKSLLKEVKFSVIRGNISEIKAVALGSDTTKGVDAAVSDQLTDNNRQEVVAFAQKLSRDTGAVIVITGICDLITDGQQTYLCQNGHSMMSRITGSGCMLSCVIGAFVASGENVLTDTAAAVCAMGLCGEMAYQESVGTSTFRMNLIDQMSLLSDEHLQRRAKIELL